MQTINKIYIGISVVLLLILAYLAYYFLVKSKSKKAQEKENYFKILDEFHAETLKNVKGDPGMRLKVKLSACKHGVTFEQALTRDVFWLVEHNKMKVKTASGEYLIPLDILLQWRDARDGRSPHYGKSTYDPACTVPKRVQVYRDENQTPPFPMI